eukprot:1196347-Prorocentrum_minimum.AAC.3
MLTSVYTRRPRCAGCVFTDSFLLGLETFVRTLKSRCRWHDRPGQDMGKSSRADILAEHLLTAAQSHTLLMPTSLRGLTSPLSEGAELIAAGL